MPFSRSLFSRLTVLRPNATPTFSATQPYVFLEQRNAILHSLSHSKGVPLLTDKRYKGERRSTLTGFWKCFFTSTVGSKNNVADFAETSEFKGEKLVLSWLTLHSPTRLLVVCLHIRCVRTELAPPDDCAVHRCSKR